MKFVFDKPACQNIRRALRKEWLLTNGLGDYASSTIPGCNTRKYHGLLVANLATPPGRHVLLSTLEESVTGGGREFFFSCRKHPGVYYPPGHEYLEYMETGDWPLFRYHIGPLIITRELVTVRGRTLLLVRYTVNCPDCDEAETPPLTLKIKPLLAFRNFHSLTCANMDLQVTTFPVNSVSPGFLIRPYNALPPLYMQVDGAPSAFYPAPDWCRNVEYFMEAERGFPSREDLFMPGVFEIALTPGASIVLSASTAEVSEPLADLWRDETERRLSLTKTSSSLQGHLRREAARYLVHAPVAHPAARGKTRPKEVERKTESRAESEFQTAGASEIIAGYHWFDAWGRDALIALPGLTFAAGRRHKGKEILAAIGDTVRNGLVPNLFQVGDQPPAFNSADASLWYVWAVQQMLEWMPDEEEFAHSTCWPVIKSIITAFRAGTLPDQGGSPLIHADADGLLHAGNATTQLTWMDAIACGLPVTPRHGCPVELNALWYNALAWADELARRYGEMPLTGAPALRRFRVVFREKFWTPVHGEHLGDVWRPDPVQQGEIPAAENQLEARAGGCLDGSIRPNQIFAVSVLYPPLEPDDQPFVVESVRNNLLTPCGLRTLSPRNPGYRGNYEGGPNERDAAYHQGTVWPWLLGAYADALFKTAWDVEGAAAGLLETLTPLFSTHLADAGLGSISEIFDGNPPHAPNGCTAQAWSVAECYRLLRLVERNAPATYAAWERKRISL